MIFFKVIPTKIGRITITEHNGAIIALDIGIGANVDGIKGNSQLLRDAALQLTEYLDGKRRKFDLKLAPKGTEFQMAVWAALQQIPFGTTISYKDLAAEIGRPNAWRAAGNAVGRNPIPIIIPCHRVLAADGGIGGFSLGLPLKRKLLGLESA
ncbi:MAG: methylated-DNA--[protein]-cysteine S-methyltransferase [Proteobacteria bacterium]|nr:methylated-DNA--[protein]-cysteine S-methyltransferase [Pseudomonadota bacterium]